MSGIVVEQIRKNGVSFRMPAGRYSSFTQESADSLINTTTRMNAHEFGVEEEWVMKIIDAVVVDEGEAIQLTLIPVP